MLLGARLGLREDLSLRSSYRFEAFEYDSFATEALQPFMPGSNVNGSGVVSPSTDLFLGDRLGDYRAHIFQLSLVWSL